MRKLIGAGIEFAIAQLLILKYKRHGIGGCLDLFLEQGVNGFIARKVAPGVIPGHQQRALLIFSHQG